MTEELKQKARDFVKEYLRDNLILDEVALMQFTTETTKELEKENIELKEKIKGLENILRKQLHCGGCVHSDSPCMPDDYKKDENDLCDNYESVFDKLQELEKELAEYKKKDKSLKCKQKYFITSQTVDNGCVLCNTVYDCESCDMYKE